MVTDGDEGAILMPGEANKPLRLDPTHFAFLSKCYPLPLKMASGEKNEAKNPHLWYAGGPAEKPSADLRIFDRGCNRSNLIAMRDDHGINTLDLCIAILAWGGMHGSNRDHLFKRDVSRWLAIADNIRSGALTRQQAFEAFAGLSGEDKLVGMGPAYYTKLIYFLMPRSADKPVGYIMDQWLGCSVNLICAQEVVLMDSSISWVSNRGRIVQQAHSRVSPLNTGSHYERFCRAVEMVADQLAEGWTADTAELALMSKGGKKPDKWRAHVVRHRLLNMAPSSKAAIA